MTGTPFAPPTDAEDKADNGVDEATEKKPMKLKLKKGALHKDLGVKKGQKIPTSKLAIKPGDSALEKKRKQFALNSAKWRKK